MKIPTAMKTINKTHLFPLGLALMTGISQAATWDGTTNNWQTDHWGLSGGYPGDGTNINATINSGTVTVASDIAGNVGSVNMSGNSVLNIEADIVNSGNLNWTMEGNSVVNQTAGLASQAGFGSFDLGYNTSVNNIEWNISGGTLKTVNRSITLGRSGSTTSSGSVSLNVSGAAVVDSRRTIQFNVQNGTMNIDASSGATVNVNDGGNGIFMNSTNSAGQTFNYHSRLEVSGYNASTSLTPRNMNIFQGANADGTDVGTGTATVAFVLANDPMGVNSFELDQTLNLGTGTGGSVKGDLEVDVTALVGAHAIKLFGYTTLTNGSFGNVDVFTDSDSLAYNGSFTGSDPNTLGTNEYFLDYGDGTSDQITLYYNAIPEPSTAMVLLGGIGMLVMRRRRA